MHFLINGRQGGKTWALLKAMSEDPANSYMICATQVTAEVAYRHAKVEFPGIEWGRDQFTTMSEMRRYVGSANRPRRKVYVDDLDAILGNLINGTIVAVARTGHASSGQREFFGVVKLTEGRGNG